MIAYLDCFSGISGDMMLSALVDAGANPDYLRQQIASLPLKGVEISFEEVRRAGIRGLHFSVNFPPQHHHRHLKDIVKIIEGGQLTDAERNLSLRMFQLLAAAEAEVHGTTVERIHFHEVGAIDSIVDLVGVAIAANQLGIAQVFSSPVTTGTGTVNIAHGTVPVPAPATACLLRGMPVHGCTIEAELTTPTGAAILCGLEASFGGMPAMKLAAVGHGAGSKELPGQANILRIMLGHSENPTDRIAGTQSDNVLVIETTLDDVTGEQLAWTQTQLLKLDGVHDVTFQPVQMKKNRPGILLSAVCKPGSRSLVEQAIFEYTPTLGVRVYESTRTVLSREQVLVETEFGQVSGKVRSLPNGEFRFKPESEDCCRVAGLSGRSPSEIAEVALRVWQTKNLKSCN